MDVYRSELGAALTAFTGPVSATEAASYAKAAKLYREWEGMADGPMDEAQWAERYLADHPKTLLRPYVELFLLHRLRAAFEAATDSAERRDTGNMPVARAGQIQTEAATRYRAVWDRVNASADPLTKALAADIDSALYLYIDVAAHPRK